MNKEEDNFLERIGFLRSSNPVMNSLSNNSTRGQADYGYGQPYNSEYSGEAAKATRPMTVDDVVTKTGCTLAVIIAFAVVNFGIAVYVNPTIAIGLTVVGGIGGFITVLVATFAKKWGSVCHLNLCSLRRTVCRRLFFCCSPASSLAMRMLARLSAKQLGDHRRVLGHALCLQDWGSKGYSTLNKIVTGAIFGVSWPW